MNGLGLTVSDSGHVCQPGEVSVGCTVARWLQSSLVPPVPNWLLITGVVVAGVWVKESGKVRR